MKHSYFTIKTSNPGVFFYAVFSAVCGYETHVINQGKFHYLVLASIATVYTTVAHRLLTQSNFGVTPNPYMHRNFKS